MTYLAKMPEMPEPLDEWALIVGDAVHNMRSALDHLACRLVERHSPGADLDRTAFPIWTDDPEEDKGKLAR